MNPIFDFNPVAVGKAELAWWKAHTAGDKKLLFKMLKKQTKLLYGLSDQNARKALALLLKSGSYHDTKEWGLAETEATLYYATINDETKLKFDPSEIAKLEVGWWKLHDELENNADKSSLEQAFTTLYSKTYNVEQGKLTKAGKLRAAATHEHDLAEKPGTSDDESARHWDKTGKLLIEFYKELKTAISN